MTTTTTTTHDILQTYRRVAHRMGAWKWGYPRGMRRAIVEYRAGETKDGRKVWKSYREVCSGITAGNEPELESIYPEAFDHGVGSIHNRPVCECEPTEQR